MSKNMKLHARLQDTRMTYVNVIRLWQARELDPYVLCRVAMTYAVDCGLWSVESNTAAIFTVSMHGMHCLVVATRELPH